MASRNRCWTRRSSGGYQRNGVRPLASSSHLVAMLEARGLTPTTVRSPSELNPRTRLDEPGVVEAAGDLVGGTAADGRVGLVLAVGDIEVHGGGVDLLHRAGAPPC